MEVFENIISTCDQLGQIELSGLKLEDADPSLLNVKTMTLDEHIAMQPSAIAYYGSLMKEALRDLNSHKREYERWQKKRYAIAKESLSNEGKKYTVNDIETRYIVDNCSDIEKWEEDANNLQSVYDSLSVWFEAWRQKSFSIREYIGITEEERFSNSNIQEFNLDKARRIINR